ncbi:hypothetical protein AA313_de0204468 [Arthrobotrys entomopaga]|nr:hypothetical protein AA313_de0204468 [Arthrobotrys entomopaga]
MAEKYVYRPFSPIRISTDTLIPRCLYGTALKKDSKQILDALKAGYTGFDTACQPQYYHEDVVGEALDIAFKDSNQGGLGIRREDIFLQSKFTTPAGQDFSLAFYQLTDSPAIRVEKSIRATLKRLRVSYLDMYLLHAPMPSLEETLEVWKVMESYVPHTVRHIGVSNFTLAELRYICGKARINPAVVQNRFMAGTQYDKEMRAFCREEKIVYQAFSILPLNGRLLQSKLVGWLAERMSISIPESLYCLVLSLDDDECGDGPVILVGTKDAGRMAGILAAVHKLGVVPPAICEGFKEELNLISREGPTGGR